LYLEDGSTILDACGGAAVTSIGFGNQEVVDATSEQMKKLCFVHSGHYTTTAAEELASLLIDGNPFGLERALFVSSGSEAMEAALKLARQYFFEQGMPERTHYVSRRQSYHGSTIGAMAVSSYVARKVPFENLSLPTTSTVSPAYAYQYKSEGESEGDYVARLGTELEDEFLSVGPHKVIAFIAETVGGATTGCLPPPRGYFPAVRAVCDKYGILLILDEVMCGMGRTGTRYAFEHYDVVPDITTVGKCLGGGYVPIAGILVNHRVVRALSKGTAAFVHGHTYQAHPVCCAGALAVQNIIVREKLLDRCADSGKTLENLLRKTFDGCRYVGDIRGKGLFWALEFVRDKKTKQPLDPRLQFASKMYQATFDRGVAIYPTTGTVDGVRGDHVLLAPSFTVTEEELEKVVDTLHKAYLSLEVYIEDPPLLAEC
jgi:adenosylmethionine-8-amino-7-oxononanoate aminotransferase